MTNSNEFKLLLGVLEIQFPIDFPLHLYPTMYETIEILIEKLCLPLYIQQSMKYTTILTQNQQFVLNNKQKQQQLYIHDNINNNSII